MQKRFEQKAHKAREGHMRRVRRLWRVQAIKSTDQIVYVLAQTQEVFREAQPITLSAFCGLLFKFLPRPASVCLWLEEISRASDKDDAQYSGLFSEETPPTLWRL